MNRIFWSLKPDILVAKELTVTEWYLTFFFTFIKSSFNGIAVYIFFHYDIVEEETPDQKKKTKASWFIYSMHFIFHALNVS